MLYGSPNVPFNSDKPQPGGAVGVANGSSHGDFTLSWHTNPDPRSRKMASGKKWLELHPRNVWILVYCVNTSYMRVSINGGTPIAGWNLYGFSKCFFVENPIKIDELRVPHFRKPLLGNHPPVITIFMWYKPFPNGLFMAWFYLHYTSTLQ